MACLRSCPLAIVVPVPIVVAILTVLLILKVDVVQDRPEDQSVHVPQLVHRLVSDLSRRAPRLQHEEGAVDLRRDHRSVGDHADRRGVHDDAIVTPCNFAKELAEGGRVEDDADPSNLPQISVSVDEPNRSDGITKPRPLEHEPLHRA